MIPILEKALFPLVRTVVATLGARIRGASDFEADDS